MLKCISAALFVLMAFTSCCKNDDQAVPTHGMTAIDNTTTQSQTYFIYGFLFSEAKRVSTLDNPDPDITIDSDGTYLYLQTTNLVNSFYKYGSYNDSIAAKSAYAALREPSVSQWNEWAPDIKKNQIWIFRTGAEHYAKIRIISTLMETRSGHDYGRCTFQWTYQPDGSLTFPAE